MKLDFSPIHLKGEPSRFFDWMESWWEPAYLRQQRQQQKVGFQLQEKRKRKHLKSTRRKRRRWRRIYSLLSLFSFFFSLSLSLSRIESRSRRWQADPATVPGGRTGAKIEVTWLSARLPPAFPSSSPSSSSSSSDSSNSSSSSARFRYTNKSSTFDCGRSWMRPFTPLPPHSVHPDETENR